MKIMAKDSSKKALVCGAGGFIGSHLVTRLKSEGFWVCGADIKYPDFYETDADNFLIGDLTIKENVEKLSIKIMMKLTN